MSTAGHHEIFEQEPVAAMTFDINAETTVLERSRDRPRAVKQGMLRQLLTGRMRLIESES